jgi:aryl-alcohol dehydrogenase-like predicted oxidoreductase
VSVDGAQGWPQMARRTLGRTGFEASRLSFGCGAALSRGRKDKLLNVALESGVNVFVVGTGRYYNDAERNLAPFLKEHRDEIFLISKGMTAIEVGPGEPVSLEQHQQAAKNWTTLLEESLRDLEVDQIDAYYQMGANNTDLIGSEELYGAFQKARAAGKVKYYGFSSHENAQALLEKAIETGWYDVAMLAMTPGGWYDWNGKSLLDGTPPMQQIQPLLARAKEAGIGLIGMKAARYIAGRNWLGWGDETAFDAHYSEAFLKTKLSAFQRSYAYVLGHGMDLVNADIQNFLHLRENFEAAATSHGYFGDVA